MIIVEDDGGNAWDDIDRGSWLIWDRVGIVMNDEGAGREVSWGS